MAIYRQDLVDVELTSGSINRSFLIHSIGSADAAANRFGVKVFRNGEPVDLTGVSCLGFFRDARGNNIALSGYGQIMGNIAFVTLPQACYNYPGKFTLSIKLVGGGVTGTMRIVDGVVDNTNTGSAVAPTGSVPTYQEILAAYDEMAEMIEEYNDGNNEMTAQIKQLHDQLMLTDIGTDSVFWEQGSINADGSEFDSDTRVRSGFIYLRDLVNLQISPVTGWAQSYLLYDDDKTATSATEWSTGNSTVEFGPGSIYVRVVAKRTDASQITPADVGLVLTLRTILHREYSEIKDDISALQTAVSGLFSIDGNTLVLSNS